MTRTRDFMKRTFSLVCLAFALIPLDGVACSCAPPGSVQEEKERSTRGFLGRVTAVEERTPSMDKAWLPIAIDWIDDLFGADTPSFVIRDHTYRRVSFHVMETFKGGHVSSLQLATGLGGGDCGYFFVTGESYVVYARGDDDALSTGICSLTGPASDPLSGLASLRMAAGVSF